MYTEDIFGGFKLSGYNLVNDINALNPSLVVDAGCGYNWLKGKVKNLTGIDIVWYPNVDKQVSILDAKFTTNTVDVVLALGPLQSGEKSAISDNIAAMVSWLKPGGRLILRNRPFLDYVGHHPELVEDGPQTYRWTWADFNEFTAKFNLTVEKPPTLDVNSFNPHLERLTWWWKKN